MFRTRMIAVLCTLAVTLVATAATQTKAKASAAKAQASGAENILPFKASEKTLPNGLKVISIPTGFPNIVAVYINVQTGSRNEVEPGKSGFAHFFEHMMFRGTKKYTPEAYTEIITQAGARQNANTSNDRTIYHTTFAKEDLGRILEIEADRFKGLDYPEEAFKTEARAVLGEYNKNSANPTSKLIEVQRDNAFRTHTYKHTTMGFIKDIEDMPNQYEYSKEFFSRWYRPEYTTIIVAGDVNSPEVFAAVEKHWSDWKRGSYKVDIPVEPAATAPVYAHVPWPTNTPPWVTVGFHAPPFSALDDKAALDTMLDLEFGETSDLYKRLVEQEQKVDQLFVFNPTSVDPLLLTAFARVKNIKDAQYVRDEIMKTFAQARTKKLDAARVTEAKSNARYSFLRSLDNTDAIANIVANFAQYERSYDTINKYYRALNNVSPDSIQRAANKYFTDNNVVVTTLSKDAMPETMAKVPALTSVVPAASAAFTGGGRNDIKFVTQKSVLPNVMFKLLFTSGSANDPKGKEGLAALAASMITDAGSRAMRIDEINRTLFPLAGGFGNQVDKEMTTFTGVIHRDNWKKYADVVLPQLLTPGFREDDFTRLKDAQLAALRNDLRSNNEEELGKEELANIIYAGTPYGHTVLGTVAGIESITLDDVRNFVTSNYTRGNLVVGLAGDYPEAYEARLRSDLAQLPAGGTLTTAATATPFAGVQPNGLQISIIKKDTRATAISMGVPLPITREDADFAALDIARSWLGEHRMSSARLYDRIREARGLNYGDYTYIEYFNRPGGQFFPSPNIARRSQMFEVWIRPVVPENAQMATRIALYELQQLVDKGMSQADFARTRDYLMKNVYLKTSTQNQNLGYALDSWWYGMPDYTKTMRAAYEKLTLDDVNRVIRKYITPKNLHVVMITKDAEGLRDRLLADEMSSIKYDAPKPQLAEEDRIIGSYKLGLRPENVRIVNVEDVFAK